MISYPKVIVIRLNGKIEIDRIKLGMRNLLVILIEKILLLTLGIINPAVQAIIRITNQITIQINGTGNRGMMTWSVF